MLNDLIKNHVAPLLKRHDFKKKGMTWNKSVDGFVQVIDFQLSSYSDDQEESFTINLGVLSPEVWSICWQKEPPKFVKEDDCFPRVRVGQLLSGFSKKSRDHWWACSQGVSDGDLSDEVTALLENTCIPFVDGLLSKQKISEFYSSQDVNLLPIEKVYLAIVRSLVDDKDSSAELLDDVGSLSKAWSGRAEIVQSQLS